MGHGLVAAEYDELSVKAPMIALGAAMDRALAHAPFLAAAAARQSETWAMLSADDLNGALRYAATPIDGPLGRQLRIERDRLALTLAIGDLAGALTLEKVTGELSSLADRALDRAIVHAIEQRTPDMPPAGFVAIALGKHGGCELNYSSDIDPILLFDPTRLPHREREEAGEGAVRIARAVVEMLQHRDGDGYVFRVDLRLRPAAEVTPAALPVNAAISHYESSALAWERAAFIKARVAAGDAALGDYFLKAIRPFVWRRSLDFGAIDELRAMSSRIRGHYSEGQEFGPGYDLKRGRGGIREIEFFAQMHQLIHGGRDPGLRQRDTLGALAALADAGHIDPQDGQDLAAAYRVLRTIEHRVQMVDDRQTHALPAGDALDNVGRLHGLSDGQELLDLLRPHIEAVGRIYDGLGTRDDQTVVAMGADNDFASSEVVQRRLADWRGGKLRALRSPAAMSAFERALPGLLGALAAAPAPHDAIMAFDRLLAGLPTALNLFRLLEARPALGRLLVDILSYAPALSDALAARSSLLDCLIDASALEPIGDVSNLCLAMSDADGDIESRLDRVRHLVGEYRFAIGTQIIENVTDPLAAAQGYSRVAESAVQTVTDAVADEFTARHGRIAYSNLIILALGRLGGGALTNASDLDLIYIHSGESSSESDGEKALGSSLYFNRLAQRVTAGLTAPTSAGALYEVDTRLRPSGNQGPLAVSLSSFERYQRESAWTWEHMALARARPIYGTAGDRAALSSIIDQILRAPRNIADVRRDMVKMRGDIATHKPPTNDLDVKLVDGGLVDLEFVVHFYQLTRQVALHPDLRQALVDLADAGLVDASLMDAHDLLTRMLVTLRLVSPDMSEPTGASAALIARTCQQADWAALMIALDSARGTISAHWRAIVNGGQDD